MLALFALGSLQAQVKIGGTPDQIDGSAMLHVQSTTRGFLPPIMNTTQRDNINQPAKGLMIYNTDKDCIEVNKGTKDAPIWECLSCCGEPNVGVIPALINCDSPIISGGTLIKDQSAVGITATLNYTGANGGFHNGQMVASTGVKGLVAILPGGNLASGNGTLVYLLSGVPKDSGIAHFAINIGGQTCDMKITVNGAPTPTPCETPGAINVTAAATNITAGQSTSFSMTGGTLSTGTPVYTWEITKSNGTLFQQGTGTSTGNITFADADTYTCKFTATNNGTPTGCNETKTANGSTTITVDLSSTVLWNDGWCNKHGWIYVRNSPDCSVSASFYENRPFPTVATAGVDSWEKTFGYYNGKEYLEEVVAFPLPYGNGLYKIGIYAILANASNEITYLSIGDHMNNVKASTTAINDIEWQYFEFTVRMDNPYLYFGTSPQGNQYSNDDCYVIIGAVKITKLD